MPPNVLRILSEPLLQFLAIGVLLYGISELTAEDTVDPNLIRVDRAVHADLATLFEAESSRVPTVEEMDKLIDRYVMNETLYREARDLRLDHGDQMMRERLIQRMRLMIYSGVNVQNPPEEELRSWFEQRAEQYRRPARISFQVIGLDGVEAEVRAEAAKINALIAEGGKLQPGDYPITNLNNRPREQMVSLFNAAFVEDVEAAEPGVWTPVETPRGWQIVRYRETVEGSDPAFEDLSKDVLADWRQERIQIEARAALEGLMSRYPVERAPYDPDAVQTPLQQAAAADAQTQ